ncbi:MAG: nitroreductase [Microgenomates group bacterium LiPW_16]|nr:MAG: nitroreductase [Microgenomates group bacterium LiPW_16]
MEFWQVLTKRHSTRAFADKPIEEEKIQKILQAANSAPSAGNLQGYEIFLVEDKDTKDKLVEAARGQDFIAQAPVVLIFVANPQRSGERYGGRGENLYSIQDATIACIFAWLAAVDLGLSACWVGAFEGEEVINILGADPTLKPIAILPIGYPAETPTPHSRRKLEELVHKV